MPSSHSPSTTKALAASPGLPAQRVVREPEPAGTGLLRVLIVDDDPDLLRLLHITISFAGGLDVCAQAGDGVEALLAWRTHRPDVVVMDLRMPVMGGMDAAAHMVAEHPDQRIILFSASISPGDRESAGRLGVGLMAKDDLSHLAAAVRGDDEVAAALTA